MHHIYCISGLGADHRIFQKLKIENAGLHFINWEIPGPGDDMRSYALRLAEQIQHPEIVLIGVSFGGMLATEITRFYQNNSHGYEATKRQLVIHKTILISSCKCRDEYPRMLNLAAKLRVHKFVPYKLVMRTKSLNRFVFDLRSKEEELYLKRLMLEQNDLTLLKRSIDIIMKWRSEPVKNVLHIHGTSDRLLSPTNVKADHWIEGGGHFMVWNKAGEISRIINSILKTEATI